MLPSTVSPKLLDLEVRGCRPSSSSLTVRKSLFLRRQKQAWTRSVVYLVSCHVKPEDWGKVDRKKLNVLFPSRDVPGRSTVVKPAPLRLLLCYRNLTHTHTHNTTHNTTHIEIEKKKKHPASSHVPKGHTVRRLRAGASDRSLPCHAKFCPRIVFAIFPWGRKFEDFCIHASIIGGWGFYIVLSVDVPP